MKIDCARDMDEWKFKKLSSFLLVCSAKACPPIFLGSSHHHISTTALYAKCCLDNTKDHRAAMGSIFWKNVSLIAATHLGLMTKFNKIYKWNLGQGHHLDFLLSHILLLVSSLHNTQWKGFTLNLRFFFHNQKTSLKPSCLIWSHFLDILDLTLI